VCRFFSQKILITKVTRNNSFVMESKKNIHIDFLDLVRGVAILMVLTLHATNGWVFSAAPSVWRCIEKPEWFFHFIIFHGHYGVAIFFVVSGFCIHLSFQKLKNWPVFFTKRFFRIYPPFLVAILFFAYFSPYCNLDSIREESHGKVLLQHLFMVNNYRDGLGMVLNPSFWSVATEIQLYLLYPAVIILCSRLGWNVTILILMVLEVGLRTIEAINGHLNGLSMIPFKFWFSWSLGAYVCQKYIKGERCILSNQSVIFWVSLCILAKFFSVFAPFGFTFAAISTAVFISKRLDGKIHFNIPKVVSNIVTKFGIYSYGIYLLHQPFFYMLPYLEVQTTPRLNARLETWFSVSISDKIVTLFWCILISVAVYFLSALFYRLVEKPSVILGNWIIKIFDSRKYQAGLKT
jgi:peptidoglycan/LPS O-acetylase OafA/YrhL